VTSTTRAPGGNRRRRLRSSARLAPALGAAIVAVLAGSGVGHATTVPLGSLPNGRSGPGRVGVILPDTQTSDRWVNADRPLLAAAFDAAGVDYEIENAEGDAANMAAIADRMIAAGAAVLMIVNLDNESGSQIEQRAADAGVPTVDYDRLTLGGSAAVYVSFDNVQVGVLQGEGLVECLADRGVDTPAIAVLNGSPTDNNATLAARGYMSVLQPHFDDGSFTLVDDQSVPGWNNEQAGQIFEQMLSAADGAIDGVIAANDGLADAVISVLRGSHRQLPVTGQDATVEGLRHILQGDQCMTVYKDVRLQADAAVAAAVALGGGETPPTTGTVTDTQTGREVPAIIAAPVAVYVDDVDDVVAGGYQSFDDVCRGIEALCEEHGVVEPVGPGEPIATS
jgi:D-xylose transport system substrate-binding protein